MGTVRFFRHSTQLFRYHIPTEFVLLGLLEFLILFCSLYLALELRFWGKDWQQDFNADRHAAEIIVDAMARYTLHLKSQGASPRKLSGVYDDLNSAGMLVMMHDAPEGKDTKRILSDFDTPPWSFQFERKFSDSTSAIARYERNLEGFARFLQQSGLLPNEDEE